MFSWIRYFSHIVYQFTITHFGFLLPETDQELHIIIDIESPCQIVVKPHPDRHSIGLSLEHLLAQNN